MIALTTILPLITKYWKIGVVAVIALALGASVLAARHYHSAAVNAEVALKSATVETQTLRSDAAAQDTAMEKLATDEQAIAVSDSLLRSQIDATKSSDDCSHSAAISDLLSGLHADSAAEPPSAAAKPAHVHRRASGAAR